MNSDFSKLHGVIIGLGSIGNRHLKNFITAGVGRMTIVRRRQAQNRQFISPNHVTICHSLNEALQSKPDYAVVCNPSSLHAVTAIECLEAGVNVLIEKPLGKTLGPEERELVQIAASSGRICAMAYCMRYHPAYRIAYDQVQGEAIGKCLYAKAWFEGYLPDWHPWEDHKQSYAALTDQGGGVLRTLDHETDFLNWLLGPAESATGLAVNTGSIGIEADDLAMYVLRHPKNAISQITTSFCRKPPSRGFEIVGVNGELTFRMDHAKLSKITRADGEIQLVADLADYDGNQMYMDLANDFLRSIQQDRPTHSLPLLADGVHCLQLFDAIVGETCCPN